MRAVRPHIPPPGASLPAPPLPPAAASWALFLDVDGTLLDFAADPRSVSATPSLLQLLHALHGALDGAVALVSGRRLDDLDRMFRDPPWAAVGLHGLELRQSDGSIRRVHIAAAHQARMHAETRSLAQRFDGVLMEDKHAAVALHCRQVPHHFERLREAAAALMPSLPGYELQPGDLVIEFKPVGMDKGSAVLELRRHMPFADRMPVYLGDDLTDEHAFAEVNRRDGLSVRVGRREPSAARFTLPDPAATEDWLTRVLDALAQGAPAHEQLPE